MAGEVVGSCDKALTKQAARMLAAEDALLKWEKFIAKYRKRKRDEEADAATTKDELSENEVSFRVPSCTAKG